MSSNGHEIIMKLAMPLIESNKDQFLRIVNEVFPAILEKSDGPKEVTDLMIGLSKEVSADLKLRSAIVNSANTFSELYAESHKDLTRLYEGTVTTDDVNAVFGTQWPETLNAVERISNLENEEFEKISLKFQGDMHEIISQYDARTKSQASQNLGFMIQRVIRDRAPQSKLEMFSWTLGDLFQ